MSVCECTTKRQCIGESIFLYTLLNYYLINCVCRIWIFSLWFTECCVYNNIFLALEIHLILNGSSAAKYTLILMVADISYFAAVGTLYGISNQFLSYMIKSEMQV